MSDWVNCPICGESDMRKETEASSPDISYISCVNGNCGSNGGTNFSALPMEKYRQALDDIVNPLTRLLREAKAHGMELNELALSISRNPEYLTSIAKEALK